MMKTAIRNEISSQRKGYALTRPFYTSEDIYQLDLEKYWGQSWLWAGHESQIPNAGDFFLFDFGAESVIIVRSEDKTIHANLNVCRHRGSRICLEDHGNKSVFTCPYHAWTYSLNGELRWAGHMEKSFECNEISLKSVKLINFQGLIFICLAESPPPINSILKKLSPLTQPFEFDHLKIAHSATYPVKANWKLAVENYMECYHCAPSHYEYSKSHSLKNPDEMEALLPAMKVRSESSGIPTTDLCTTGVESKQIGTDCYYRRYPLFKGYNTGSKDGKGVAPLLGKLSGYDGGATDLQIGSLNNFLIYSDHLVAYRFIPTGCHTTDIQTVWLVRDDAEEGKDYNLDDLTWLWHVTTQDDERIIKHNQQGVNSFYYEPGPLSTMEFGIPDFHHSYLSMLKK